MADNGVVVRYRGKETHCQDCLRITVSEYMDGGGGLGNTSLNSLFISDGNNKFWMDR